MHRKHVLASGVVALVALFTVAVPSALALPPGEYEPFPECPRGYEWVDGSCEKIPRPVPPAAEPKLLIDLARQMPDRKSLRLVGWTADADAPTTPLTIRIYIDGVHAKTMVADAPRPPTVPPYGDRHGFDVVLPAQPDMSQVCIVAEGVGGGNDAYLCRFIDRIVRFAGNRISYDLAHAEVADWEPETLDKVTNTNATTVQQSTTLAGAEDVTDTQEWMPSSDLGATVDGKVGIPFMSDSKITVRGQLTYAEKTTTATIRTFSWAQPLILPAMSKVVATMAVTRTTLIVPYTLTGDYVYAGGFRTPGSVSGTYTGVNRHDLEITLRQYNLDGTPAVSPVRQPPPTLLATP